VLAVGTMLEWLRVDECRQASTRSSVQMTGPGRTGLPRRTWASGLLAMRPSARRRSAPNAMLRGPGSTVSLPRDFSLLCPFCRLWLGQRQSLISVYVVSLAGR
jgi:hypothetical protein